MIARCTNCESFIFEVEKKGVPLPTRCKCAGLLDRMISSGCLKGVHPYYPGKTFKTLDGTPYFYAYKNAAGNYYVSKDDRLLQVDNPIQFVKP